MKNLRRTKIVCTIGPASEEEGRFTELVKTGLNVARINFSHGGYEDNAEKIATIKRVRETLNQPIALMLDTKGPEIRTGQIQNDENAKVDIVEGQTFTFTFDDVPGDNTHTSISYKNMYQDIKIGNTILVCDGLLGFEVKAIEGKDIVCTAMNSGRLGSRKNVNVPGVVLEQPALAPKDVDDLTKGVKAGFDYIAASFIRRADDVKQIRKLLDDNGGQDIGIISKIESQEGIDNFEEILELSDGIMVARGDMGVEIPMEQVPIVQKRFIKRCNEVGKPVITATQMLESMISNPRPTRAEVSDVANAVYDLTGCIMLSGECAMGKYPVECVSVMNRVSTAIEGDVNYWKRFNTKGFKASKDNLKANTAYSACVTAQDVEADAILAYTHSGETANILAGFKPGCPVIAVTDDKKTYFKLAVANNTLPIFVEAQASIDATIAKAIEELEANGTLEKNDKIVIAGGSKILPMKKESQVIGGIMKI